jgi:hypothetical protein
MGVMKFVRFLLLIAIFFGLTITAMFTKVENVTPKVDMSNAVLVYHAQN